MRYWLCEYQSETDVSIACKKLNGFPCHGTALGVIPALRTSNFGDMRGLKEPRCESLALAIKATRCRMCDKKGAW